MNWAFSDLATQFHIIPGIVYQNFEHVVSWGELRSYYSLFLLWWGTVHGKCRQGDADIGETDHKSYGTYLNDHLEPWIQENNGWDTFVELWESTKVIQPIFLGKIISYFENYDPTSSVPLFEAYAYAAGLSAGTLIWAILHHFYYYHIQR
ncbi:hypothetical protein Celaphus_00016737, partial [Cervus elaphus hippelaphus]